MKLIIFLFILFEISNHFIFSSSVKQNLEDPDEDLKLKIYLTKQTTLKLKKEIMRLKNEENFGFLNRKEKMNFKEIPKYIKSMENVNDKKSIIETKTDVEQTKEKNNFLEEDFKKDLDLSKQVNEYFDKNPNHLQLDNIEKDIRTSGKKEFEDIIDMLDNHPENFGHGTRDQFYTKEISKQNNFNLKSKFKQSEIKSNLKPNIPKINKIAKVKEMVKQNGALDLTHIINIL